MITHSQCFIALKGRKIKNHGHFPAKSFLRFKNIKHSIAFENKHIFQLSIRWFSPDVRFCFPVTHIPKVPAVKVKKKIWLNHVAYHVGFPNYANFGNIGKGLYGVESTLFLVNFKVTEWIPEKSGIWQIFLARGLLRWYKFRLECWRSFRNEFQCVLWCWEDRYDDFWIVTNLNF